MKKANFRQALTGIDTPGHCMRGLMVYGRELAISGKPENHRNVSYRARAATEYGCIQTEPSSIVAKVELAYRGRSAGALTRVARTTSTVHMQ